MLLISLCGDLLQQVHLVMSKKRGEVSKQKETLRRHLTLLRSLTVNRLWTCFEFILLFISSTVQIRRQRRGIKEWQKHSNPLFVSNRCDRLSYWEMFTSHQSIHLSTNGLKFLSKRKNNLDCNDWRPSQLSDFICLMCKKQQRDGRLVTKETSGTKSNGNQPCPLEITFTYCKIVF